MTKSIQDYRNIVKILKLQLLKVREENSSLSNQMGIISQSETSSFTPKINKYKQSNDSFAQKVIVFLQFAHRCQLVGITPEMVFRIADKKRDKEVNSSNLSEVIKRVKIKMTEDQINKFIGAVSRNKSSIGYQEYLQIISAFQINSEKYPPESARTYVQLCLISFVKQCKSKFSSSKSLFEKINRDSNSFNFDNFVSFCGQQCKSLQNTQMVAVFLGLDIQSLCQIQREIFLREMDRVYSLVQKGVSDERPQRSNVKRKDPKRNKDQDGDFLQQEDTGVEAFKKQEKTKAEQNKLKEKKKNNAKSSKGLEKASIKEIEGQLKKYNIDCAELVYTLVNHEKKKTDKYLRAFSLGDISVALKQLNSDISKKAILNIFKRMDKNKNGSTGTDQLIKILIRTESQKLNLQYVFALLYRHFKQTQFPDPLLRFTSLGYKPKTKVSQSHFDEAFQKLQFSEQQQKYIYEILIDNSQMILQELSQKLKKQPTQGGSSKKFEEISKDDLSKLTQALQKIQSKTGKKKEPSKYKKLIRMTNKNPEEEELFWQTIFEDQWDCFRYCLDAIKDLKKMWRDPQFGPSKSDKNGLRSIFGNQNQKPRGLPQQEEDILWLTYEQILRKKQLKQLIKQVKMMDTTLESTDVMQGTLGDCWYISALSIITLDDECIKGKSLQSCLKNPQYLTYGIYPQLFQVFAKYGLYVFKFFKQFKPKYVIVDDLFPVQSSTNDLIFAKSPKPNIQWVSFAEKAYAKLHHSYTNMISGDIAQGLNDLTNFLPVKQVLLSEDQKQIQENMKKISQLNRQNHFMGCSIKNVKAEGQVKQTPVQFDGMKCGLVAGHAYSIIDFIDLKTKDRSDFNLMRIRNPWGHGQWVLNWSDNPINDDQQYGMLKKHQKDIEIYYQKKNKQMSRSKSEALAAYKPGQDGQFLMQFEEWNKIFTSLFIGFNHLNRNFSKRLYTIDVWDNKKPSGLCKAKDGTEKQYTDFVNNNHQYILNLTQETQLLMLLIQRDGRLYRGQKYPYKETVNAAIILVFQLKQKQESLKQFDKDILRLPKKLAIQVRRDVDCWCTLPKGRYAVFPCKNKNNIPKTEFQFRIYSNKQTMTILKSTQAKSSFKTIQQTKSNFKIDSDERRHLVQYLSKKTQKK